MSREIRFEGPHWVFTRGGDEAVCHDGFTGATGMELDRTERYKLKAAEDNPDPNDDLGIVGIVEVFLVRGKHLFVRKLGGGRWVRTNIYHDFSEVLQKHARFGDSFFIWAEKI